MPVFGQVIALIALSIPIIAIIDGITAGIVRTLGQQRLAELAHRERIAALERGLDPSKLPPAPIVEYEHGFGMGAYNPMRRFHGLLIAGIVCLFVGVSIAAFLSIITSHEDGTSRNAWAVGLIPMGVGVALLLSAALVRPRNGNGGPRAPGSGVPGSGTSGSGGL
ncbi:MAG: hypothetical protein HY568_05725 [Candidatus Latescibacteria bacterium]|nr:hypothetical protein [Candidatus Latescibacterota bacterium]